VGRFELLRTQAAEVTMAAGSFLNPLFLQAAEERLRDGIVPAVSRPFGTQLKIEGVTAEMTPR